MCPVSLALRDLLPLDLLPLDRSLTRASYLSFFSRFLSERTPSSSSNDLHAPPSIPSGLTRFSSKFSPRSRVSKVRTAASTAASSSSVSASTNSASTSTLDRYHRLARSTYPAQRASGLQLLSGYVSTPSGLSSLASAPQDLLASIPHTVYASLSEYSTRHRTTRHAGTQFLNRLALAMLSSSSSSSAIVAKAFCEADVTRGEVLRATASDRKRLSFERALIRFGPSDWIVRAVVPLDRRTSGQAKSDVVHAVPARVVAATIARDRAVWLRRVVEEMEREEGSGSGSDCDAATTNDVSPPPPSSSFPSTTATTLAPHVAYAFLHLVSQTPRETLASPSSATAAAYAYLFDRVEISRTFFDTIELSEVIGLVTVLAHRVAVEYPCDAVLRALRLFASEEARVPRRLRRAIGDLLGTIGMRERVCSGGGGGERGRRRPDTANS